MNTEAVVAVTAVYLEGNNFTVSCYTDQSTGINFMFLRS